MNRGLIRAVASCMLTACVPENYQMSTMPSLRPVDSARAMVVFSQIDGRACGTDAVLGAIRDMTRLNGIDGYLEVVIEASGEREKRCARATAFPFRYGNSTKAWTLRTNEPDARPVLVPSRLATSPQPSAAEACSAACESFAGLLESAAIARALARDRCVQRCRLPDPGYAACITAAHDAAAANACLTLAEPSNPVQP
jgi:hypothetical protein